MCTPLSTVTLNCLRLNKIITVLGYRVGSSAIITVDNHYIPITGKSGYPTLKKMFFNLMYKGNGEYEIIDAKYIKDY